MIAIRQLSWPLALWTVRLTFLTAMLLGQGGRALGGADTNGVSPNTISRPSGPGSLEDLGASFQPAPFGSQGNTIRTSDLGFNKRIDVIQSQFGALFSWYNQGDGRYPGPIVTDAPYDGSRPVEFSDSGVHLADMNGDRLVDVVKITTSSVIWWANSGYGRFGPRVEILLPDRFLDGSPGGTLHRARLQDISGNGTTDLVYTDSTLPSSRIQVVDLGELIGGSPHYNLLTSIDYAYGRKTEISYRTTTEYLVDAFVAGHAWTTSAPFPSYVVSRTRTSIGLDLDGYLDEGPDGDVYLAEFVYRDGYYDPIEHQFRGFAFVKQIDRGDERSSRYRRLT